MLPLASFCQTESRPFPFAMTLVHLLLTRETHCTDHSGPAARKPARDANLSIATLFTAVQPLSPGGSASNGGYGAQFTNFFKLSPPSAVSSPSSAAISTSASAASGSAFPTATGSRHSCHPSGYTRSGEEPPINGLCSYIPGCIPAVYATPRPQPLN